MAAGRKLLMPRVHHTDSSLQGRKAKVKETKRRQLCTQAGNSFTGKFLKQTSLRNLLYLSKTTETQIDTANISEGIQDSNDRMDLTFNFFRPQFSSVKWG